MTLTNCPIFPECPSCGSTNVHVIGDPSQMLAWAVCGACMAQGPKMRWQDEATRRTIGTRLLAEWTQ